MSEVQNRKYDVGKLKDAIQQMEQVEIDPVHLFAPGIYVRVLTMPAGATIVSKIHKTEHFCLAVTGRAVVINGDEREEVVAPKLFRTMPGTQRALHILEESTWITFHPTEETDLDKIEQDIIAKDFDDPVLLEYKEEEHGDKLKRLSL